MNENGKVLSWQFPKFSPNFHTLHIMFQFINMIITDMNSSCYLGGEGLTCVRHPGEFVKM